MTPNSSEGWTGFRAGSQKVCRYMVPQDLILELTLLWQCRKDKISDNKISNNSSYPVSAGPTKSIILRTLKAASSE